MRTAVKIRTFQRGQMTLASLGHKRNESPFNKAQLWIFVKVLLTLYSHCEYIAREHNTTKKSIYSIFMIAVVCLINVARMSTLFKNATIFNLIDTAEELLNGRELIVALKYSGYKESIC